MANKNVFKGISIVLVVVAIVFFAAPALSEAANYGYVNHSGTVMMYTSDTSANAIRNAPNISLHSGVILLDSQADSDLVGDHAYGV